jgi:hypothetical protein
MFEGHSCDNCGLHFSGMPQRCYLNEANDPVLSMLPSGSRPLDEDIRQRLPTIFFKPGEFYFLRDALCIDCFHMSRLLSSELHCCLKCGSTNVKSADQLQNKTCPKCKIGVIRKNPESGIFY